MDMKKIALGSAALAAFGLMACNQQESSKATVKAPAAITANSTDDQKFAYMLGAQFGGQNFTIIPRQMGEELYEDALLQAIRDNVKANEDTNFNVQMTQDSLQAVGNRYTAIARKRMEETRPDSATIASFEGNNEKIRAYIDSVSKGQPIAKAPVSTGAAVTIKGDSPDNAKFSYLLGLQFANQFISIGKQFQTEFDEDYFILGIKESVAKVADSTYTMQLPQDSLNAVGMRYQQKMQNLRAEAIKKQQEEEAKLKEEIAPLRGDTLANGMPQKLNYKVKTTKISVDKAIAKDLENLEPFANKPLLVMYFSATCGHCAHAAPEILEIAKEFAPKGLTTVAVASGGNQKVGIRKFVDNAKWDETINVVWDESRQFGELYSDGYVPKVYAVNPDGTYKLYAAFEKEKEDLKKDLEGILSGKNVEWKPEAPKTEEKK
ncbi:FKBP-type peptidyl-prolyl cis-trans isomerase N-terminal domain-containing protein [uncultured Fibrobacter sp.]|uniref:FKBP-type peptidyl-prolyl cis-trans isomerase N-terminal domain-containing protein n=1 Tax=uncultured Fibrobacter sp. TaxID=261512 RepID=UPI00262DA876|nr:FKBP-type peptidyl-prolyl cis-trans isomerase N-terminal domain-containing protein [uncultured Fibrobacter sp.]